MKLVDGVDTDIEYLVKSCNSKTVFLSDWNKCNDKLIFPESIVKEAFSKKDLSNLYIFSEEIDDIKKDYAERFTNGDYKIKPYEYAIVSNGTMGGFLALNTIRKALNNEVRALLISPMYFAYVNILRQFGADINYVMADMHNTEGTLNLTEITKEIEENKINLIIITNPLFGSGVSLSYILLEELAKLSSKYNAYLLIDNIYGGLKWEEKVSIVDYQIIKLAVEFKNILVVESISKSIFLNGIKIALVFANKEFITDVETDATIYCGSISAPQMEMFFQIYNRKNDVQIKNVLFNTIKYCKKNFKMVKEQIKSSGFIISECKDGIFCLVGIPYRYIQYDKNYISDAILKELNILVISHDRYLLKSPEYFYFRLNLTMNSEKLIWAIQLLIERFSKIHVCCNERFHNTHHQ